MRRTVIGGLVFCLALLGVSVFDAAHTGGQARAAGVGQPYDWNRFYYYPYVYYPQSYRGQTKPYDNLYYRYSPQRQIPVYNKNWHYFYPSPRPYHKGNHFTLDIF